MITISAFADEIGPELELQMETCESNDIKCIDVRGIEGHNVAQMSVEQAREYHRRLDDRGFEVPCIGSPIGKIRMDDDFEPHLEQLKHCAEIAEIFGTDRIRIFSFYPSEGKQIEDEREGVMARMSAMVEVAEAADVVLHHENESGIYGAKPAGVRDLFETIRSDRLKGIFDPANFVTEGVKPYDDAWTQGLAELTDSFHIKDKVPGEKTCVPAGKGEGQFRELFGDLKSRGYDGYMTLEPHLKAAGQFAGFSGPDLFTKAANALKAVCDEAGLEYKTYS